MSSDDDVAIGVSIAPPLSVRKLTASVIVESLRRAKILKAHA